MDFSKNYDAIHQYIQHQGSSTTAEDAEQLRKQLRDEILQELRAELMAKPERVDDCSHKYMHVQEDDAGTVDLSNTGTFGTTSEPEPAPRSYVHYAGYIVAMLVVLYVIYRWYNSKSAAPVPPAPQAEPQVPKQDVQSLKQKLRKPQIDQTAQQQTQVQQAAVQQTQLGHKRQPETIPEEHESCSSSDTIDKMMEKGSKETSDEEEQQPVTIEEARSDKTNGDRSAIRSQLDEK